MLETIKEFIPSIHKEGYVFILLFVIITFVLQFFSSFLGCIGLILTAWCVFFFRDPIRVTPQIDSAIVSPADGIVQRITIASPPKELSMKEEEHLRISIFLNVFDVHVNRIPIEAKVKELHYHPGKFFNASLDKASIHNERQSVLLEHKHGELAVVQIAGLIARRIVCDLEEKQEVKAGERFGIIRFGSRVDVYLPKDIKAKVIEGQRVIGGETILADLKGKQLEVSGVKR